MEEKSDALSKELVILGNLKIYPSPSNLNMIDYSKHIEALEYSLSQTSEEKMQSKMKKH